jgi:hypothetical protein
MKVIYKVTVTVPDDPQVLGADYELYAQDEDNSVGPIGMASIVMAERLNCDEDYGFEYSLSYDALRDVSQSEEYVTLTVRKQDLVALNQLLSFETETPGDNWTEGELESLQRLSDAVGPASL